MKTTNNFVPNERFTIHRLNDGFVKDQKFLETVTQLNDSWNWMVITDVLDTKKIYIVPQAKKCIKLIYR